MKVNKRNFLVLSAGIASVGYMFSIASGSIGLMIFLLAWLINYKDIQFSKNIFSPPMIAILGFYLMIIVYGLISSDGQQAQKEIVRFMSFLIFPLIFSTTKIFNTQERNWISRIFVFSLVVFFLVCMAVAWKRQIIFWNGGNDFNWYFFYRYDFLEVFKQHPTYISIFTVLALCIIQFLPQKERVFVNKYTIWIVTFILTSALILYGSRIGYILFVLFGFLYMLRLLKFKRFKEFFVITSVFGLLLVLAWQIPIVKERIMFTAGHKYDYKYNKSESVAQGAPEKQGRLLIWSDAVELIKEQPWGYGTGASRGVLLKKYEENGHELFLEERYNAHNTYLEILLWGGPIMLLVYLIFLATLFFQAYRKRDLVLFYFFLIITITGITETLFLAQGIFFIGFFYCFLNQRYLE